MQDLDCQSQALRKYIVELITHGLIRVIRQGQGSTNIYIITERSHTDTTSAAKPAPVAEEAVEENAGTSAPLNSTPPDLRKSKTEEHREEEYRYFSSSDEKYPSSTRKTKNSGYDYV